VSFLASKRVRAAVGVAMAAAGAPAVWDAWKAFWPSVSGPYVFPVLYFLFWGTGWAVLAVWAWRAARVARGWRRAAGVFVTAVLILATLASFAFITYVKVASIREGWPVELDVLGLLFPGLLVGGVWLLWGRRQVGRAPSAHGGA
jgi:hypothetical protein